MKLVFATNYPQKKEKRKKEKSSEAIRNPIFDLFKKLPCCCIATSVLWYFTFQKEKIFHKSSSNIFITALPKATCSACIIIVLKVVNLIMYWRKKKTPIPIPHLEWIKNFREICFSSFMVIMVMDIMGIKTNRGMMW